MRTQKKFCDGIREVTKKNSLASLLYKKKMLFIERYEDTIL